MTKICFWHLFLRDSGLIYFQLATVEPVIYLKSSGKTKVTKVRFFRKNLTSGGELALKNAHFYYKFPFCANLLISLGVFFSQVWLIIAKIGIFITDMCWSVTVGLILPQSYMTPNQGNWNSKNGGGRRGGQKLLYVDLLHQKTFPDLLLLIICLTIFT